jgi:hypothetical protein
MCSPEVSKKFFFEKKNQKTFGPAGCGNADAKSPDEQKFFAYFFQKRSACLFLAFCMRDRLGGDIRISAISPQTPYARAAWR